MERKVSPILICESKVFYNPSSTVLNTITTVLMTGMVLHMTSILVFEVVLTKSVRLVWVQLRTLIY